jgi:putative hemolysin
MTVLAEGRAVRRVMTGTRGRTTVSHMVRRLMFAAVSLTVVLAACGDDSEPSTTTPTEDSVQIANPASQYCVDQGGTVEIVTENGGEVGYCNLPDGTRVDEWEYFRQETGNTQP